MPLKRRRFIPYMKGKVELKTWVDPDIYDSIMRIAEIEDRPYEHVAGALMLLGAGVWRRLREDPRIAKGYPFDRRTEMLLLADLQKLEVFLELQKAESQRIIKEDEDRRTRRADLDRQRESSAV